MQTAPQKNIVPKNALFLGLLALTVDLFFYLFVEDTQYRFGSVFLFLSAGAYGIWAGLLSASVSTVPFALLTESYFSFPRILLLCVAIAYFSSKHPKIPLYITVAMTWTFLFLPIIFAFNSFVPQPYFSGGVSSDMLCAFLAGLILMLPSFYGKMELPIRQISARIALEQCLTLFAFITGIIYLHAWNISQISLTGEMLLLLTSLLLGTLATRVLRFFLDRESVLPPTSRLLTSSTNWRDEDEQKFNLSQNSSHWMTLEESETPITNAPTADETTAICVLNQHLKVTYANDRFCELFSLAPCLDQDFRSIGLSSETLSLLLSVINDGFQRGFEETEIKLNHLPDQLLYYAVQASVSKPQKDDMPGDQKDLILTITDITAKRVVSDDIIQAQKANTLCDMTIPIAHSFNNFLTIILGQAEMAKYRKRPEKALSEIIEVAREASSYVWKFLGYSQRRPVELTRTPLASLLHEYLPLLQDLSGDKIEILTHIHSPDSEVLCDSNLVAQAVTNLVVNAKESYDSGSGQIHISMNREDFGHDASRILVGARAGRFVRVRVKDSGKGMTSDVLERAFEPSFTTKKSQAKAGLGLSVVFAILRAHDGFLTFESAPGKGTEVSLYFPLVNTASEAASPLHSQIEKSDDTQLEKGDLEKILVVEDEPSVRDLVVNMLSKLGYVATGVESAQRALECCQDKAFDLILVDLMMPKMNGMEFIEQLKRDKRELNTVIMTGYGITTLARKHGHSVLPKPFDMKTLSNFIATALESGGKPELSHTAPTRQPGVLDTKTI